MPEVVQEKVTETDTVGDQVVERESYQTTNTSSIRTINKNIQIVYYIEGILLALLALRFVLRLLGASAASPFVNLIYSITLPFVYPFFGMFRRQLGVGAARLEFETLIAIAAYALLVWIVVGLLRLGK